MARVYAIGNQKGGVGKTTTCLCLGEALTLYGKRVLCIDLDPQAALTVVLGLNPDTNHATIYEVIMGAASIEEIILKTKNDNFDLIPSRLDLAGAEAELLRIDEWQTSLKKAIEKIRPKYDYILLDCPPSLGVLTIIALIAADRVIVPVQAEFLAMVGLKQLNILINEVRKRYNPKLETRILRTMYDRRTLHNREVAEELERLFGEKVYKTVINRTIKFADASYSRESILSFAPSSEAAKAYRQLAEEVIEDEEKGS
jgi:chromosome partitioning protein